MWNSLNILVRALWFVLEIIMAKNENNSHAFIRKMVENIKQTKDAQAPSDPKTNEVLSATSSTMNIKCMYSTYSSCWQTFCVIPAQKLYTVCDVAMHIIMSKSTTYSLESPKDPVLPSSFFTKPDKVGVCTPKHFQKILNISSEAVSLVCKYFSHSWAENNIYLIFFQCFGGFTVLMQMHLFV